MLNQKLLIVCIFLLSRCQHSSSSSANKQQVTEIETTASLAQPGKFENGKVINPVINHISSSQSFALYLPKKYSPSSSYPVVYFFDSHAGGRIPLDKYSQLGDEFNFILIGSNDSKNGMQPEALTAIANNLMQDVQKRYSINISRQYLAGFSGGARVAAMIAMQTPGIAGVIACSAGFNANNQNKLPFAVVGIAGKEDFNMTELIALNKALNSTSVPHQLLLFNGKHQWCPAETMAEAFLFLETVAMRNKTASVNNHLLTDFKTAQEKEAKKYVAANKLTEAAAAYEKIINYLDGLQPAKQYKLSLQSIVQNKSYLSERIKEDQLTAQENQLREHYLSSFGKEIQWWHNEVSRINVEIKRQENSDAAFMLKRMLASLSLASYMQANSAIKANELDKANYILEIYRLVDPANSEAWYLSAQVHAMQGKNSLSIHELQKAIDNGFKEPERAGIDPAFNNIAGSHEFISTLRGIKN